MKRLDAIKIILARLSNDDIALFTTGMTSREAFSIEDRPSNFYMIGSMGLVSSVGLGIALNTSKRVLIIDGDGSLLMDMGTMAMISSQRPNNLFHIVLDNEAYESTGNQPSISKEVDLAKIAKSVGYKGVYKFHRCNQLKNRIETLLRQNGPLFVLIKLDTTITQAPPPRVSIPPEDLTRRTKNLI